MTIEQEPIKARRKKLQTAMEYLSIYAWAIVILVIVVTVIAYLSLTSSGSSSTYLPSTCYISATLNCQQMFFMSNSTSSKAYLFIQNNMGVNMSLPAGAFSIQPGLTGTIYTGNCYPANAIPGTTIECVATIPSYNVKLGTQLNPKIQISYRTCTTTCQSTTFNTSGSSTVYVSSVVPTYGITLETSSGTGGISVDGVRYAPNSKVIFLSGVTYNIAGDPPPGYTFQTWSASTNVTVPMTLTANEVATATTVGNGTLTATFLGTANLTLSFSNGRTPATGTHDIVNGSLVNPGTDTVYLCASSNAGGTVNSACDSPNNYKLSSGSGSATFDTVSLSSGTYYFEACDYTYYLSTHKTDCTSAEQVVIKPLVSLSVTSQSPHSGVSNPISATTSSSTDNVVICDDNYLNVTYFGCGATQNQQLAGGIGTSSPALTNTQTFPVGSYTFIACDATYYTQTGTTDCSPTNTVGIASSLMFSITSCSENKCFGTSNQLYVPISSGTTPGYLLSYTIAGSASGDKIILCSTSGAGSASSACATLTATSGDPSGTPYTVKNATVAPGLTTNTSNAPAINFGSVYTTNYYEACDVTFYLANHATECVGPIAITIVPNMSIGLSNEEGLGPFVITQTGSPAEDLQGAIIENHPPYADNYIWCDDNEPGSDNMVPSICPPSEDQELTAPTFSTPTAVNVRTFPVGVYHFVTCDSTFDQSNPGLYDCSGVMTVNVIA